MPDNFPKPTAVSIFILEVAMTPWLRASEGLCWRPELADENGLLAVGGDLSMQTLISAYRSGVFPWYEDGQPICWWSPDPRAVFEITQFHVSRRLARTMRGRKFDITVNNDFAGVIHGCADRSEGTWIGSDMLRAYQMLHEHGVAHSVEVWSGGRLAGGLYGIAIGGLFAGESMFARVRDASKVALAFTHQRLRNRGFTLFDIQFRTSHTNVFGAVEISRAAYLSRLKTATKLDVKFG